MSLFNNYNKPGPGVLKNNGYEPNRFTLYFQLLGRKFWSLCILNLIFVLFSAPFVALSILLYNFLGRFAFISVLGFQFHFLFSLLPFAFIGPVLGAVFKVARDFAREEPVFIFSDFLSTLKKNIGKPIALSAISYLLFVCLTFALPFYYFQSGISVYVFFPLCLLGAFAVVTIQHYIYTMAVAFELSMKDILKNALILTFVSIGNSILMLVFLLLFIFIIVALLMFAFQYPIIFGFLAILLACFFFGFYYFTISFITHPVLQRYIVDPYYKANPQKTSAALERKTSQENKEELKKEVPEYVYHNGRMVHRSVLESENLFDDNRRIGPDHNNQQ